MALIAWVFGKNGLVKGQSYMSGIEELRERVTDAEKYFGSNDAQRAGYGERLIVMMNAVEGRIREQQDEIAQQAAKIENHETEVAVYFGAEPGETVPDPYFDGEGPDRVGCTQCGACMTGCRVGKSNSTAAISTPEIRIAASIAGIASALRS